MYSQVESITLDQLFVGLHIQMIDLTEHDAGTRHINVFCQRKKDKKVYESSPRLPVELELFLLLQYFH
jgi:hypothetical protein